MHCGEDFREPVDAETGRAVENRHTGGVDDDQLGTADDGNVTLVGALVVVVGLFTLPWVTPPGMALFYFAAAVGPGLLAARQPSVDAAVARGGTALAAAPFLLWALSAVVPDTGEFSLGGLVGPVVYAAVVLTVVRQFD